jgi:acetyl/propionyl-CoA carboxylase alpha subunit
VDRLRRALDETLIGGVQTDLGFHRWLVDQAGFVTGAYDTGFIGEHWGETGPALDDDTAALAAAIAAFARTAADRRPAPSGSVSAAAAESGWARQARREAVDR